MVFFVFFVGHFLTLQVSMPRIVIVGAGVSGLALAFRLQERLPDADIAILERADRPGGTTWSLRDAGFLVECGPNGFLDTKPATLELCRALAIELVQASTAAARNRYLFLGRRLRRLPDGLAAFVSTDLLSWRGKISLLWERFRPGRTDAGDESIDDFARRRAGPEAAEIFADALVTGIYAGDPKLLSLPACFPRIAQMEREFGSVMKGFAAAAKKRKAEAKARGVPAERPGKMWSLPGGLRGLIEALIARLKQAPIYGVEVDEIGAPSEFETPSLALGTPSLARRAHWRVRSSERSWEADAVVLTCPAYAQAAMLAGLDAELAREIGAIAYNRIAVVALGFRQADVPMPLDGFGYIAPQNTRRDLLGVQWCSSIYPGRAPADCVLLRAMCGGWHRPEIVDWDDAQLLQAVRNEMRSALGIQAAPIFHQIIRWDKAIPQYHIGHLDRVARIERALEKYPGLWLAGNAYHGVALNDCTEQAVLLAERMAHFLPPKQPRTE